MEIMWKGGRVSACIFVFLIIVCPIQTNADCVKDSPPLLNDITMRDPTSLSDYWTDGEGLVLNDRELNTGWYSAVFNGRQYLIADSGDNPTLTGCNTLYPVYLEDQHPSPDALSESPKTLKVCTVNLEQTCDSNMEIMIRRCDKEIQYFLEPTLIYSAYCFSAGEVIYDTAVPPPSNVNLGTIKAVPELRFKEISLSTGVFKTQYQPYIQLRCVFLNSSNHFYFVQWKIDGKPVASLGPSQNMDDLSLHENVFENLPLGYMVQCSVFVSAVKFGQQTQPKHSDRFYAGVRVLRMTVTSNWSQPWIQTCLL